MLTKANIVGAIQQINRSAPAEWLLSFDLSALQAYLEHLQTTLEPRGRTSRWIRPGDTPAIVTRQPAD